MRYLNYVKVFTILLLVSLSYTCKAQSLNEYNTVVNFLYHNESFKKEMAQTFNDPKNYFYVSLMAINDKLFENGTPVCDLSDVKNICFVELARIEALTKLWQETLEKKGFKLDTQPFYKWKKAVINGKNISPYLINLLDKNFKPTPR